MFNAQMTGPDSIIFLLQIKLFNESKGVKTFTGLDYACVSPFWTLIGSDEQGFDPQETRWKRKNKKI